MRRRAAGAAAAVMLVLLVAGCGRSAVQEQLAGYAPERVAKVEETRRNSNTQVDEDSVLSTLQFQDMCGTLVLTAEDFSAGNIERLRARAKAADRGGGIPTWVEEMIQGAQQGDFTQMRQFIDANGCNNYRAYG